MAQEKGFFRAPLEGLLGLLYKRSRSHAPLMIAAYNGHGTPTELHIQGRVLVNKLLIPPSPRDSAWKNFRNSLKRFRSAEIEGARVRGSCAGQSLEAITDAEGFFSITFKRSSPLFLEGWQPVFLELLEPYPFPSIFAESQIFVVSDQAEYGVISDIDDTVLHSNVAFRIQMLLTAIFKNAHTRLPFEGVTEFYQALTKGASSHSHNPLFYVSSSPWNIYDMLIDFFKINDIPQGTLFLRDWTLRAIREGHGRHKREIIQHIMETHPHLDFVLIGDSGEKDPEIYQEIALSLPHRGRIRAIYIRNVRSKQRERLEQVRIIAQNLSDLGVPTLLLEDTQAAVQHARALDLIE